jgi:hypothetical protein
MITLEDGLLRTGNCLGEESFGELGFVGKIKSLQMLEVAGALLRLNNMTLN